MLTNTEMYERGKRAIIERNRQIKWYKERRRLHEISSERFNRKVKQLQSEIKAIQNVIGVSGY